MAKTMDDLFGDLRDNEFENAEPSAINTPSPITSDLDDEFEHLRRRTTRSETTYEAMDTSVDDEFFADDGGFLSNLTTQQKLILLALLVLDLVAIGFGILVLLGRI